MTENISSQLKFTFNIYKIINRQIYNFEVEICWYGDIETNLERLLSMGS